MILRRKAHSNKNRFDKYDDRQKSAISEYPHALVYQANQQFADEVRFYFTMSSEWKNRTTDYAVDISWDDILKIMAVFVKQKHPGALTMQEKKQKEFWIW